MLLKQSKNFRISDNSGAVKAKCIGMLGGSRKKIANLNDWILLTVKKYNPKKKIRKKIIYFGLIISLRYANIRLDGTVIKFNNNRVLIFNKDKNFMGSRIIGPICREFKKNMCLWKFRDQVRRIISYAKYQV